MYKNCYDENHTYIEFNANEKSFNKKRHKGLYEKLFCRDCEDIFMRYEDYAKAVLYDNIKPAMKRERRPQSITEYNYTEFKLFILSVLWRSSISSLDAFKLARLGKYDEELRVVLLKGLETKVDNFPCVLYQTHSGHNLSDGVFMEIYPRKTKFDGKTICHFIVDGLFIFIGVGVCSIKYFRQGSSVSPENLRIGYYELSKLDDFLDLFDRLSQQGKFSQYEKSHNKKTGKRKKRAAYSGYELGA